MLQILYLCRTDAQLAPDRGRSTRSTIDTFDDGKTDLIADLFKSKSFQRVLTERVRMLIGSSVARFLDM